MKKLKKIKEKVFQKYQCDILKKAFSVDCEGTVVRSKVAETALRGAINDMCDYLTKPKKIYDFWGQEIEINEADFR